MMIPKIRAAIIGCGVISDIYFNNITRRLACLELAACCDLNAEAARRLSDKYNVPYMTMEELLSDQSIKLVINLTPPMAHAQVIRDALMAGKHVYTEKPLAATVEQAREVCALTDEKKLMLCAAPDTFLGAAGQTARWALDSGMIGKVTSCAALLNRDGGWMAEKYPFTAFPGGGIGTDVGIYYVTMMLSLLGPVTEVCGMWDTVRPQRKHYSLARREWGETYELKSENLVSAVFRFANGCQGVMHLNANSIQNEQPHLILYGTEGMLYLPDPNRFGGEVRVLLKGQQTPFVLPMTHGFADNSRGLGVADMAWALRKGRKPRADKALALHGLELLLGAKQSAADKCFYQMKSTFERPAPLPRGYLDESYSNANPENGLAVE